MTRCVSGAGEAPAALRRVRRAVLPLLLAMAAMLPTASATLVAVGGSFSEGVIRTSPDGVNWTVQANPLDDLSGVASDGSRWVAVGDIGAAAFVITSTDATNWTPQVIASSRNMTDVAHGNGKWVAVGATGTPEGTIGSIVTSSDARTWTPQVVATTTELSAVANNGTAWVTVGDKGAILTSPDGTTWTSQTSGTTQDLKGIAFAGKEWLAVGAGGTVLRSQSGKVWSPVASGTSATLNDAAHDGTRWIVAGASGLLLEQHGTAWLRRETGHGADLGDILHCGTWIIVGDSGTVLTSPDGREWTPRKSQTSQALEAVASNAPCPEVQPEPATPPPPPPPPPQPPPSPPSPPTPPPPSPAHETVENMAPTETPPIVGANTSVVLPPPVQGIVNGIAPSPGPALQVPWSPLVIASGSGLLAGLLAARWLLPAGLFTRLRANRLLDHPLRADIHAVVRAQPGIHFREIARRLDRTEGVIRHHLNALVEGQVIRGEPSGTSGWLRYFALDIADPRVKKAIAALWGKTPRMVLGNVMANPGTTIATIAASTGLRYRLVQNNVKLLRQAGLIATRRSWKTLHLHPTALAQRIQAEQTRPFPHVLHAPMNPGSAVPGGYS